MNKKTLFVLLLIAFLSINKFEAKPSNCNCGWTKGGWACGRDDGSRCWHECCGRLIRSVLNEKGSEQEPHLINQ